MEVVVGLDFGSSGSGFAYAYKDNEEEINPGYINGANVDNKVPTEIILDNNNDTLQFGAECIRFMKEKGLESGHYFKEIKMNLYEKKTSIAAKNSGKVLPLKLVIQRVLEKLKDLAFTEIKKNRPNITLSNIKWVVTVPAIWQEFEKNIMMEACIDAGLVTEAEDKSLFFALEPEAASCYCSKNKSIDQSLLIPGECYIICDLGGGTGDIVAHLIGENYSLKEIYPASGGDYGSDKINKKFFEDIIYKIFDCKDFNNFYLKYKQLHENGEDEDEVEDEGTLFNEWCELDRQIKDLKEGTDIGKVEKNEKYPINCSIFQGIFDKRININKLIDNYNNKCSDDELKLNVKSSKKWIISFPYKIIYNYIKNQTDSICKIINKIIESSDEDINSMILVGGYCSNEILISEIKNNLSSKISHFLQPSKPCLSIMEGAVIFGLNPTKIIQRKAKYTIGTTVCIKWNEELHSNKGKKSYNNEKNIWMCNNCFSPFIIINQSLTLNQEIKKNYNMHSPRYCMIRFYKTLKPNPNFVDEEEVEEIGNCRLDAGKDYPPDQRGILITMRIGGTFIDVKAKHKISGNFIKTKLDFN